MSVTRFVFLRKEIAIRKVNGADTCGILKLFSANVLWTALPAVLIGAGLAYWIGMKWLEQFSESVNLSILVICRSHSVCISCDTSLCNT